MKLEWRPDPSLTVVLAARGYPGSYAKGGVIRGLESVSGAKVFHAGTAMKDLHKDLVLLLKASRIG